jgi:rubrerythrin
MGTGPKPAELVVSAVHSEREAALFYRMMAEMAADSGARDRLLELANDESAHAATLAALYHEMTGRGITETAPASAEGDPDLFDFHARSQREVLEFALQNELAAIDLYETATEHADNRKAAAIFRLLADTEREHAAYLRLQLSRLEHERASE